MTAEAVVDGSVLRLWTSGALTSLGQHCAALDDLNVFPVADSDTGTNLYLTIAEAGAALDRLPLTAPAHEVARTLARGALVGARGNSGVIVSQYLGALLRSLVPGGGEGADPGERAGREAGGAVDAPVAAAIDPDRLSEALASATAAAYSAVGRPVEGTVLTVASAVGEAARAAGRRPTARTLPTFEEALDAGYRALARTPDQLEPLRSAGVLDAGAWGLLLVLDALAVALGGRGGAPADGAVSTPRSTAVPRDGSGRCPYGDRTGAVAAGGAGLGSGAPGAEGPEPHHDPEGYGSGAFEVMYVVERPGAAPRGGAAHPGDGTARELRSALGEVGESVAVVGGDGLWQAHVHTDRPLAALAVPAALGARASQVRVRHLESQAGVHGLHRPTLGLVTVTAAPRLVPQLAQAGAVVVLVVDGTAGAELGRAVDDTGADQVLVLSAAGLSDGRRVHGLLPSGSGDARGGSPDVQVEVLDGLSEVQVVIGAATLATLDRTGSGADLAARLSEAVESVRCAVVRAPADEGGDAGVGAAGHADLVLSAATDLLSAGGSLVTVLTAEGTRPEVAEVLTRGLAAERPGVELVVLEAGVPGADVALGVE